MINHPHRAKPRLGDVRTLNRSVTECGGVGLPWNRGRTNARINPESRSTRHRKA